VRNLSVGISTVFPNLDRAKSLAAEILTQGKEGLIHEVLIVCQRCPKSFADLGEGRLKVLGVTDAGLSKSRNLVLQSASGDFVWFLDDDVTVTRDSLEAISSVGGDVDVLLGQIGCSDGPGFYKNYRRKTVMPFALLRVSSIELIVNRRKMLDRNVFFDERLGLGAQYPCGEENAFLLDLYRSGARFEWLGKVIVFHPCGGSEVRDYFRTESQMYARGIVASKFGFWRGGLLCFYWSFRVVRKPAAIKLVLSMLRGFLMG